MNVEGLTELDQKAVEGFGSPPHFIRRLCDRQFAYDRKSARF